MKLYGTLFIIGLALSQSLAAQNTLFHDPDCCTSIMVGKEASSDGSVITLSLIHI